MKQGVIAPNYRIRLSGSWVIGVIWGRPLAAPNHDVSAQRQHVARLSAWMVGVNASLSSFWLLWASQACSLLGTDLAQFGLRLWAYRHSQSLSQFSWITFFAEAPSLILSPVAGLIADKYSRKRVMMAADTLAMMSNVYLLWLYSHDHLTVTSLSIATVIQSICSSFHWPAFVSTMSLIVPKDKLVQYGALNEVVPSIVMMLAPSISAFILSASNNKLHLLFMIEFVTFVAAFAVMISLKIPDLARQRSELPNFVHDIVEPFQFMYKRPALLILIVYLFLSSFVSGINQILVTPLLLSFSDPTALGLVITVSGVGGIIGGIALSVVGGPRSNLVGVLSATSIQGLLLAISGLAPSSILQGCVGFLYTALLPMLRLCRIAIFQRKTPARMQGRVFAVQRAIKQLAMPLASLASGFLADQCEGLLADKSAYLGNSVGRIIGIGKGRGIAFLFIILGALIAIISGLGFLWTPLRKVDTDLPDQDHLIKAE